MQPSGSPNKAVQAACKVVSRRAKAAGSGSQIVAAPTVLAERATAAVSRLLSVATSSAAVNNVSLAAVQQSSVSTTQEPRASADLVSAIAAQQGCASSACKGVADASTSCAADASAEPPAAGASGTAVSTPSADVVTQHGMAATQVNTSVLASFSKANARQSPS